jgi:3-hydroxybutyryl-CoA dehydrogenase
MTDQPMERMSRVVVVGAGTMGRGIAQVCATAGQHVTLVDRGAQQLRQARDHIRAALQRRFASAGLAEHPPTIVDRIRFVCASTPGPCHDTHVAIEAVREDVASKKCVLAARAQIFERSGDPRFEPPQLLRDLVAAGHLGRKSGRGFFEYGD